jgi:hypothetical protein
MGVTWSDCSRHLTLKRQNGRSERKTSVSDLGQVIRVIQRQAAGMPTAALRDEIAYAACCPLEEAIIRVQAIQPGVSSVTEKISAHADLMDAVLVLALYVQELAHRPLIWADAGSPN